MLVASVGEIVGEIDALYPLFTVIELDNGLILVTLTSVSTTFTGIVIQPFFSERTVTLALPLPTALIVHVLSFLLGTFTTFTLEL